MADKSIILKNCLNVQIEGDAVATITPGMLIELTSTANALQAHSNAGQNAVPLFALEDELQGNNLDVNYDAADKVQAWYPQRGDEVLAILADGENASIGSFLESNGAGYLQVHVADTESFESGEAGSITVYPLQIVAQAIEALDLSDSSGAESSDVLGYNKRIRVRIV
jgi:hypothetical protein